MKTRVLTIILVLALLVGIFAISATATEQGTFQAGYAVISVSPTQTAELDLTVGLPMSGYGNANERLTTGFVNDDGDDTNGTIDAGHELMATCVAVTDAEGNSALLISIDTNNTNQNWTNAARTAISKETGVPYHNIFINASGTYSAPEISYGYSYTDEEIAELSQSEDADDQALYTMLMKAKAYREFVNTQLVSAAVAAMADRTEVTMAKGELDVSDAVLIANPEATTAQQKMNYNTHYAITKAVDGVETTLVSGTDFGPSLTANAVELTEVNDKLYLLQFIPTDAAKTPIVLANWRAMANLSSNGYTAYGVDHRYKVSSDYIGSFRDAIAAGNYRAGFLTGADANVTAYHRNYINWDPDVTMEYTPTIRPDDVSSSLKGRVSISPVKYGQKLAAAALYALNPASDTMKAVETGVVQTMAMQFSADPNLPTQDQIDLVVALKNEAAPEDSGYSDLCTYLVKNWSKKSEYENDERFTGLQQLKENFELAGIVQRSSHSVFSNRTNFATDAAFCEMHAMMIGEEVAFVISPMELYDRYSKTATLDNLSDNDWDDLKDAVYGTPFVMTHSNGASNVVPNYLSASYNEASDTYATGCRDFHYTDFERGAGEDVLTTYVHMFASMTATDGDHVLRCECGGAAAGVAGHTCEDVEWLAWSDPNNLPSYGNYYLTCDVTYQRQLSLSRRTLRIDLNGHTLTRKVQPEVVLVPGDEVPEKDYYTGTRALSLTGGIRLVITDSSEGATGKFTRDISALSEADKLKISNYGLLVAMNASCTNEVVLYNGTLDTTGQYSGGGACVANMSTAGAAFKMYGGELIGGISDHGTAIYGANKVELLGGKISGGQVADTADADDIIQNYGAVFVTTSSVLTLGGDATVTGCIDNEGKPNNITLNGKIKVNEGYNGKAGLTINATPLNGRVIGTRKNVSDAELMANLALDSQPADDTATYSIVGVDSDGVMIAELRTYCECGGKVVSGTYGHICENITWKPWPYSYAKYLPDSSVGGTYYLLTDIELVNQKYVGAELHLDMNGHNITHKVQPSSINVEDSKENTRVFYLHNDGSLTITDSTENVGTITRDLSALDDATKNSITNWGLMILISETTTGDVVLYDGILDATDMVSGGGATVANLSGTRAFRMYGGTLKGGKSDGGGNIYTAGPVELYGGTVTGGINTKSSIKGAGVRIGNLSNGQRVGSLVLGGDASVTGNFRGTVADNIYNSNTYENFTVRGTYTGTAGISLKTKPAEAMRIGISDNADITGATLTVENYADCDILNKGGYLILNTNAAYISTEPSVKYKTLASAIDAYPGDNAVIVLLREINENDLAITKQTYLDLNGFDVVNTGFNANGNKLYVLDSMTDDYTVDAGEDQFTGYGTITGDLAAVAEGVMEGNSVTEHHDRYMRIVEDEAVSFHRLNLRIVGITLRPSNVGVYYTSQFGGDEVIKRNIVAYGTALGANEDPSFRDKTYTRLLADTWLVGADKNGNSNNLKNGTLLQDIMVDTYSYSVNSRNSRAIVNGQSYVELADGTRICGPMIGYSLKDIYVGADGIVGVDTQWDDLDATTKTGILDMYSTYRNVMRSWNIPNIKAAASAQS